MKQENVSRIEQRADLLLSTLDFYLKSLGGYLRLVAEFKDRSPVTLTGFGKIQESAPGETDRRRTKGRQLNAAVACQK
jgi:hypothetical protein